MPKKPPTIPKKPLPSIPAPPKMPPKPKSSTPPESAPSKTFSVKAWTGANEGEKVVCYGDTGLGKTTLCSMMPNPVFVGIDDGGRRIINAKTQEPINHVPGIECFQDVRDALHQTNLWPVGGSCVIDTFTDLASRWAAAHVVETIPLPKGKGTAKNLKSYGWNDGSSHVLDAMRLILQDLDALIRRGTNVGLVCQEQAITIANPEGADYLQACPKLHHDRQHSLMLETCAWADQVFRLGYFDTTVLAEEKKIGKIATSSTQRAIYIQGAQYFRAKSRTLNRFVTTEGEPIEVVAFEHPADDSIWRFIFPQE